MLAPLVLYTTEFLWFVLPTVLELTVGYRISQTRYSAGILALMHSAQYIWITSYYARQEARSVSSAVWAWPRYFAVLVLGGIALFVPGPWLASYTLGLDFSVSFLVVTAIVNIHHFMLDGAVWKLRESRVSSLLIGPAGNTSGARPPAGASGTAQARKFFPGAAAAVLLLVLAGLDQTRNYFSQQENSSSLALAATLNPNDSIVHARLGRAHASAGETEQMERALKESVRINPYNADAQGALARLLIESRRYEDAYNHYQEMLSRIQPDAQILVNVGLLLRELNQPVKAIETFDRALQLDKEYQPARLYLAETLAAYGRAAEAVTHYEQYIQAMSSQSAATIVDPRHVLNAAIKLAGVYSQTDQPEKAIATYKRCADIAEQSGQEELRSFAMARIAEIQADGGATEPLASRH
jgi:tetratricopeptide (TPR) repeat protein